MDFQILEGIERAPVRGIIYGVEGIGKTTLGASLPGALILDVEDGSRQINCRRVRPNGIEEVNKIMKALAVDARGTKTLVIDTADWLERMIAEWLCKRHNVKSVEKLEGGYGKGYVMIAEAFSSFLNLADALIEKGINVFFVAHSWVKRVSPPDQTDGFDRYEMKLSKQASPLLREWAEVVLFCNYRVSLVEGQDGRTKAIGGTERVVYTVRSAAWDAKNRFGLPEEIPMENVISYLVPLMADAPNQPGRQEKTEPAAEPKAEPVAETPAQPPVEMITPGQLKGLHEAEKIAEAANFISTALEFEGAQSVANLTKESAGRLIADVAPIVKAHRAKQAAATTTATTATPTATTTTTQTPAPASTTPFPNAVAAQLDAHADKVNAYLRGRGFITQDQTWRDVAPEMAETLITKTEKVLRAAGVIKTP